MDYFVISLQHSMNYYTLMFFMEKLNISLHAHNLYYNYIYGLLYEF